MNQGVRAMGEAGQASSASGDFVGSAVKPSWWASHSYVFVFFGSLALLSSTFAAAPWKKMDYGRIDGYGDLARYDLAVGNQQTRDEPALCDGRPPGAVAIAGDAR